MLGVLMAVLAGAEPVSPISEAAVRGTDLCVQMQSGKLNLRGEDTAQSKTMVLASETGPGGVFLGLSPNGCDVLIGSDGVGSLDAVRAWMAEDSDGYHWRQVPSLGTLWQGARGDEAQYFVSGDFAVALAVAKSVNDMGRVVVLPPVSPQLLRLRVETATRASQRTTGQAVMDAVNEVCPLMAEDGQEMTREKRSALLAHLRSYSVGAGELAHAGEDQDTVIAQVEDRGCQVAVRARAGTQITGLETEVPRLLEAADWKPQGDGGWRNNDGATLRIHSSQGVLLVEVDPAR